jgi:hypothetical protein
VDNWKDLSVLLDKHPFPREEAVTLIKEASIRYMEKTSVLGTQVHSEVERLVNGGIENCTPHTSHFKAWAAEYKPQYMLSEATVYNRREGYAGTLDFLAKINTKNIIIDVKTGKNVYPEVALQLCAYAHGEFIGRDNRELELPHIDGAAVLHLRPRGFKFIPVRIDDEVWQSFRYVKEAHRWKAFLSKRVFNTNGSTHDEEGW